jgi:Tfp pilus assembly protein PilN
MLVEINLLPEREPRKFAFVLILTSLIALILIVSGFYIWQIQTTKSDIASVDRQISMTRKIAAKESTKTNTTQPTNSVGQLESAIKWAKDYPVQTIPVMRQLTSLLPERGFIQSFGYTEAGTVSLTVQFDSTREAAYFLNSLNNSEWIKEASLNSLTAAATSDTNSTGTGSSQSTETTTGQTAGNATTASGTAGNQPSTTNTTGNTSNQTTATSGTANASNQTAATANQTNQTTDSTTNSTTNAATTTTDKYLPRYIGQFEITLNKDAIKKLSKKSTNDEKGVTGS